MSTKFYDLLINEIRGRLSLSVAQRLRLNSSGYETVREAIANDTTMLNVLSDERCKRILFDARQAATFDALHHAPPEHWQAKLHPPFRWFYLELTEPIAIGEQEPGHEDVLRAITYRSDFEGSVPEMEEMVSLCNITFWFTGADRKTFSDRSFLFQLESGMAATRIKSVQLPTIDPSQVPETLPPDQWFFAGSNLGIERRYKGWYERTIMDYGALLSWCLIYMMAKGVHIVPEPVSRQQRRLQERKGLPVPWHIVRVEPRFQQSQAHEEPIYHHSYRYDVMGHLRFGRHRLVDGQYRETIEWVRDHQRGLDNDLYIPKTSKFEGGKVEHPAMGRYFTQGAV